MERFIYVPKKNVETAFAVLKPDSYEDGQTGKVIDMLLQLGLKITYMNMGKLNDDTTRILYKDAKAKVEEVHFENMVEFMKSHPVVTMLIEGTNAITDAKKLRGPTSASEIIPGTIRELRQHPFDKNNYDKALDYRNVIHWTVTPEEAKNDSELIINTLEDANEDFTSSRVNETNHFILNPLCYIDNLMGIIIDEFCKRGRITTLQMGYLKKSVIKELYPEIKSGLFPEYMLTAPIVSLTVQGRKMVTSADKIITSIENNKRIKVNREDLEESRQFGLERLIYGADSIEQARDNYSLVKHSIIYR